MDVPVAPELPMHALHEAPPLPATPITQLAQSLLGMVLALLRMARWFLHFGSITLPSTLYRILHYSMTVKVTFPVLALWCIGATAVILMWLRYWHWNRYEYVREAPIRKIAPSELTPDVAPIPPEEERGSFHSYLDEFLQAIRIFGFLERPVFHELARHLQTRRMLADDELSLDTETSFYIVIDGHVQVFAPAPGAAGSGDSSREYQLVNDVKSGGTLSSLFTILRLFTEQVELGFHTEDDDVPPLWACDTSRGAMSMPPSVLSPFSVDGHRAPPHSSPQMGFSGDAMRSGVQVHGSVARARRDTTLAVIPAEAFRRLTAKYPSSASHIVQVILARLARVTFHTAHQYLGLTREVMQSEYAINQNARAYLPPRFYEPEALEELWRRFHPHSRPSVGDLTARARHVGTVVDTLTDTHDAVQPGDLHSMVAAVMEDPVLLEASPRSDPLHNPGDLLADSTRYDALDWREEIMHCIANSMGLTQAVIPDLPSVLESPFLASHTSAMASAYSNLSRLDASTAPSEDGSEPSVVPAPENGIEVRFFRKGSVLAHAGQVGAGLFYVIDGQLDMRLPATNRPATQLFSVERGGLAGYLSSLLGVPSFVDIVAEKDTYVGYLPVRALERLLEKRPNALLTLSKRLLSLLPPLIVHIDAALDWVHAGAGQVLFREGDEGDSLYIVINGRLRALRERSGQPIEVLGEYGQGDSVGEDEVMTRGLRTATLHSIRDSELARMPTTLFNAIALWHPPVTIQMSRIIAKRMRQEMDEREKARRMALPPHVSAAIGRGQSTHNLKTVAVLPASPVVPIAEFGRALQAACAAVIAAPVAFLSQGSVIRALGRHAFSRMGNLKLAGWLADQEQHHRLVLYMVDTPASSSWASTCMRQADCILLVGLGDEPQVGEMERMLLSIKTTARKELVLLHPERSVTPGTTREWLKPRPWVSAHHHIELPGLPPARTSPAPDLPPVQALRTLTQQLITRMRRHARSPAPAARPAHLTDFARLARRLCGASIGLVLGGGGARGCAHMGVLRALEELGIPIDLVGGTSIGSFVGGLYARDGTAVSSHGRAKRFAGRMASLWRFVTDVTYPLVSYTTGHEFNRGIFKCFADTHIEDMWLPYFCNTTNITWSRMEVHTSGYAWRYIRASMTLAGLVPPMIDEGDMLVDGGYTDNLPVSIMLALGARTVLAVDVSNIDDTSLQSYGDTLSGWWVLLNRLNPWSSMRTIPNIPDIQSRLMYTTSNQRLEDAKADEACLFLRMPIEGYGTLEFGKYTELLDLGYHVALERLAQWQLAGRLPMRPDEAPAEAQQRGARARRHSL
ncbi:hypothetical protein MEQU1_001523 [Malassezia equina]|uniref:Lysophospholipase NTE1 n=1 Tax=Malassezia equina TaxID=1381935 RepID=A0AAF0EHK1_9BASI|nr:hypothetical protein MEQU1_001523 [Malassezia equina]